MTLIERLRGAVGAAAESADGETAQGTGLMATREPPLMDLEVPDRVETATFALG